MNLRRAAAPAAALLSLASCGLAGGAARPPADEIGLGAAAVIETLPRYAPRPVAFPSGAPYVTAGGAISVVGYNDMEEMLEAVDALFCAAHPGFRFELVLKGTRTAAPALARGLSAFAPMGAEFTDGELESYRKAAGSDPVMFRVAHDSVYARALSSPQGIFVNRANPLEVLTTDQVARIFTTGHPGGDLKTWGDLGLTGTWAAQPIHPAGPAPDTAIGTFMRRHKFGDHPYAPSLVPFHESDEVVAHIGEDPLSIGFASLFRPTPRVKIVAIDSMDGRPPSRGRARDIMSGHYPYDRHLLLYARRNPDGTLDPFVREYLRLVLSREGQEAVARGSLRYLPLNAGEVAAELAKLDP